MNCSAFIAVKRPRYAVDKVVTAGMRIYIEDGAVVARRRAPDGGGRCVGVVADGMGQGKADGYGADDRDMMWSGE